MCYFLTRSIIKQSSLYKCKCTKKPKAKRGDVALDKSYIAMPTNDYAQSANTLFHFMGKEEYLKDLLIRRALIPRYCIEDIEYLGIHDAVNEYKEAAVLQKCFCDIPFHKLTETFSLEGVGTVFEELSKEEKLKLSTNNTHPDFYGTYAVGFSKSWGEKHNLQPIHYLNEESSYTHDFSRVFGNVLQADDVSDEYADDMLNRLAFVKPLRGIMKRRIMKEDKKEITVEFWKNFHDEKEWRYVPCSKKLSECHIERVIANPYMLNLDRALNDINESLKQEKYETLWLKYDYDDIRYIIVPNAQARIDIINTIMSISSDRFKNKKTIKLKKYILISKILVLDEIRKDW